jgi:hypothetical protein
MRMPGDDDTGALELGAPARDLSQLPSSALDANLLANQRARRRNLAGRTDDCEIRTVTYARTPNVPT